MRLQKEDLISYCNAMRRKTDWKYNLIAEKSDYWFWKIAIQNNENWESEGLTSGLTLREAHEFVRAFYRGLEYSKILDTNNK